MKYIKQMAVSAALLITSFAHATEDKIKPTFSITEVAPGLYALMGVGGFTGGNIGLSVGDDGVVMIDDSMPPMLDNMKKAISSITDKPVDFLINTHVHGDHTGNNEAMGKDGTHIVAHENLRQHLLVKGVRTENGVKPAPRAALPVMTFSHSMSFHLNNEDAYLFHVANAHTDGDAVIHFKNANVIHTGDTLFNSIFPFIDLANGGSVDGFIAAQELILSLSDDKTRIIPGHGPLANKEDLKASLAMLKESKKRINQLIASGKSEDEVVKLNPLASYHDKWSWGFITTEKMTRQMYKGLTGGNKQFHEHESSNRGHSH